MQISFPRVTQQRHFEPRALSFSRASAMGLLPGAPPSPSAAFFQPSFSEQGQPASQPALSRVGETPGAPSVVWDLWPPARGSSLQPGAPWDPSSALLEGSLEEPLMQGTRTTPPPSTHQPPKSPDFCSFSVVGIIGAQSCVRWCPEHGCPGLAQLCYRPMT